MNLEQIQEQLTEEINELLCINTMQKSILNKLLPEDKSIKGDSKERPQPSGSLEVIQSLLDDLSKLIDQNRENTRNLSNCLYYPSEDNPPTF